MQNTFGLFDDDLPQERHAAEHVLERLLSIAAVPVRGQLKHKIFARLGFAGEQLSLDALPVVNKYANHLSWLEVIAPLLPAMPVAGIFMHELRHDNRIMQALVVTRTGVPEEIHEEYTESFFILQGRCECMVGSDKIILSAGDYLDIPLYETHTIKLLTEEVVAILQYKFLTGQIEANIV